MFWRFFTVYDNICENRGDCEQNCGNSSKLLLAFTTVNRYTVPKE